MLTFTTTTAITIAITVATTITITSSSSRASEIGGAARWGRWIDGRHGEGRRDGSRGRRGGLLRRQRFGQGDTHGERRIN